MSIVKNTFITILWKLGFFPYCQLIRNPFKIYEWITMNQYIWGGKAVVLYLGCGNGNLTILNTRKFQNSIGIDPNENAIKLAKKNLQFCRRKGIQFIATTIEKMSNDAQCFDGVTSYCVFEHIPNYKAVLSELYKVLKPGGWILFSIDSLSVIKDRLLIEKHKSDHHVVKYFTINEITELFLENGFDDIFVRPILKSKYAEKLFIKGINNGFGFNRIISFLNILLLFIFEKLNRRENEGIFLIIKAYKRK